MRLQGGWVKLRWIGAAGAAWLGIAVSAPLFAAEDRDSPIQFWLQSAPADQSAQRRVSAPTFRRPRPERRLLSSVTKPRPKPGFVVGVFGDAFATSLAGGLTEAYAGMPDKGIDDRTGDDGELTRSDPAAWGAVIAAATSGANHLDAAVMMLGANDTGALTDAHGAILQPGSPDWNAVYADRVERLAATFRDKNVPLIWVGLPVVRDAAVAKVYADLNAMFRERASKAGATFVDSWEAFTDDNGQYSATGPDVNGQTVKLRRVDGSAFTRAGGRKLASFIEPDLKRTGDSLQATKQLAAIPITDQSLFDQALAIDINAQIRREAGLPASQDMPPPASMPVPEKPKIGPVVLLSAPPLASDGQLATLDDINRKPSAMVQSALIQGRAFAAQPGRTDDFTWPQP